MSSTGRRSFRSSSSFFPNNRSRYMNPAEVLGISLRSGHDRTGRQPTSNSEEIPKRGKERRREHLENTEDNRRYTVTGVEARRRRLGSFFDHASLKPVTVLLGKPCRGQAQLRASRATERYRVSTCGCVHLALEPTSEHVRCVLFARSCPPVAKKLKPIWLDFVHGYCYGSKAIHQAFRSGVP